MDKTLRKLVDDGYVTLESDHDNVRILRRRFNKDTGDEESPMVEIISKAEIDALIAMRTRQLEDLQMLQVAITKMDIEKVIA